MYGVMQQYQLADPLTIVGVVGTIAKESASSFRPVAEAYWLSDAAREAWYKNTAAHAPYSGGWQYYGRGYIQTTHDYNYKRVQDRTGLSVLANPDLLLQPEPAAHALCVFWQDHGLQAVSQQRDWAAVRRAVYGGYDADGIARIQHVEQVLGV